MSQTLDGITQEEMEESDSSSAGPPQKSIIRMIAYFSIGLVCTILACLVFSVYRESDRAEKRFIAAMQNKLEIAVSTLQQETERLRIVADAAEEQSQKFAGLMDYDNLEALTTMLQTLAHRYAVDYVFLFNENRRLLTTNHGRTTALMAGSFQRIVHDPGKRTGIETFPGDLIAQGTPPIEAVPLGPEALCFKSILPIIHDTGETYGFIALINLVSFDRALIEKIGHITGSEVVIFDSSQRAILSTLPGATLPFPQAGLLQMENHRYLATTRDLLDADGRQIGAIAVLLDEAPLLQQRKELVFAGALPFLITLLVCIALLASLKYRVFDKVAVLSTCLGSAGMSAEGLAVRVPLPPRKARAHARDEVDAMAEGFNHMMDRLQETYNELQEAKRALEKSHAEVSRANESMQTILKRLPFGVVLIGRDKILRNVNAAAVQLLGYRSADEIIGRVCHQNICPAEHDHCPILDLNMKVDQSERTVLSKTGQKIPILKTVIPIRLGREDVLLEAFIDISELKAAQTAAETASRTKSEFLANMSHELRTPLNHIIGFTELVLSCSFGELTAEQEEFLNDVLSSSRHLLSLINDVLDLSKVEAGKMQLELAEVRIRELLNNSLMMVKEKALKHQLRLSVELDGVPERLIADERKFKQVVYNLLSNAVKFTPDGGEVRLGAAIQDAAQLSGCPISTEKHAKWLSVWVVDTGIGIEPKDLRRIFDPFEQVEGSASRKHQGTGLGLSLTRKLVELHSGAIWAESAGMGCGSTFRFAVPASVLEDGKGSHSIAALLN